MYPRKLILLISLALCVLAGACATVGNSQRLDNKGYYRDQIATFLISSDSKTLIAIGEQHHYFIDLSPGIRKILASPYRQMMKTSLSELHLDEKLNITGSFSEHIDIDDWDKIDPSAQKQLIALGFEPSGGPIPHMYWFSGSLTGKRYNASEFELPPNIDRFNKPFEIRLKAPVNGFLKGLDTVVTTPLAIAADGVMIIGAVAGAVVVLPIALVVGGDDFINIGN